MVETMQHWLDKQADLSPNRIAIEQPNRESVTFSQLRDKAKSFARKLASQGVKSGNHIAIYATNSIEMITAIHSLSYIGAIAVLLNTRLSNTEVAFQLKDANVSLVLSSENLLEKASLIENSGTSVKSFEQINKLAELDTELKREICLEDLCTIIYTSGTTGLPKGVQHSYGNHWWSAISSALNLGLSDNDRWLVALPLFHVGGLSILMKSIIYGMPVYLLEKFDVDQVHHGIVERNVTIVSVVSIMLVRLIEKLGVQTYPKTLRCMLLGGGPASKSLLEQAKSHGIPVFQTYGMTETSSQIATLSPKDALTRLGSAGKALFPAQLKIVNNAQVSPVNEIGEIFVKGLMVTSGYLNNDKADKMAFQNGWLATGDLGYLDDEGFLYVMDRRKDLIISGGENIYPAEVESVLDSIQGVAEAGVIGSEDDRWGQIPIAFIVKNKKSLDEKEIVDYCLQHLAKFKVPKRVYFVDALPRNASNKLVRHKLINLLPTE
ncbi:o-succinylbenzoate--CoA ligase [Aquibacillus rhizosphaerae]|uniref:2-succinylbenzoate--CoA ligase n=1 Tax=Aquibacillus rhizosphaerae TaxID=3051431 RepID=A0ABT7L9M0_9BACI|nr:o-succinylbenzoate--CoA ligase [Aquibacillus sp. LR5S19]MDL4842561.1 o-succinylbenzoate--CoA ligase [Aquibacillus sp. LR5S19]